MNEDNIPKSSMADFLAALAVSGLLLLTAWGNAVAMVVVSLLGLAIAIALLSRKQLRGAVTVAAVACVVAFAISLVHLFH